MCNQTAVLKSLPMLLSVVAKLTFSQVYSFLLGIFILRFFFFFLSLLYNFIDCLHLQNKN